VKYIILSILVLFSLSAYSQIEDTPLFVGKYFGNQSGGGSGYWQVTGNFTDESGYYDATSIQVGDVLFFVDSGIGYHLPVTSIISASGSSFTIRVNNTGISGVAGVPNGPGGIYRANSPKGIWPFTAGLTASDQQTLNSFLIKRLNNEPVKRDTFITVPHSTNYIPNLVITTPSRFYNNIYISCKGISDTSTVAFLAAPTSDHYGVVYNIKNDSGLVETRILSDAHFSNVKTLYFLRRGQTAQVRALKDQAQSGAYKWAVNLLWDSTATGAGSGITALTGDVTASGTGSVAATIANNAVTSAKVASQTLDSTDLKNRGITLLKLAQSGATNGQVPKFNTTTGNWEPAADAGGSAGNGWKMVFQNSAPSDTTVVWVDTLKANIINQAYPIRLRTPGAWQPAHKASGGGLWYDPVGKQISNGYPLVVGVTGQSNFFGSYIEVWTPSPNSPPYNGYWGDTIQNPMITAWDTVVNSLRILDLGKQRVGNCCSSGANAPDQFAKAYAKKYGRSVRLIYFGIGGRPIEMWSGGVGVAAQNAPYYIKFKQYVDASAITRMDLLLFSQGEQANSGAEGWYKQFKEFTDTLRNRETWFDEKTIVIASGLGFTNSTIIGNVGNSNESDAKKLMYDDNIYDTWQEVYGVETDGIHFTPKGHEELGRRLFSTYEKMPMSRVKPGLNTSPGTTGFVGTSDTLTYQGGNIQILDGTKPSMKHYGNEKFYGDGQANAAGTPGTPGTAGLKLRRFDGTAGQVTLSDYQGNSFTMAGNGLLQWTGSLLYSSTIRAQSASGPEFQLFDVVTDMWKIRNAPTNVALDFLWGNSSNTRTVAFARDGRVYINPLTSSFRTVRLDINETSTAGLRGQLFGQYSSNTGGVRTFTRKARNTQQTPQIIVSGDTLYAAIHQGYDGTNYLDGVRESVVSGTVGSGSLPSNWVIETNSGSGLLEGLRVSNNQRVGVGGVTSPTAIIHAAASTTSAASYRVPTGTAPSSPNEGDIWQVSNDLHFYTASTDAILARVLKGSATLDFGSTAAGAVTDLTITVTGAADGDVVGLSVPNASQTTTGTFSAWVSATNTVTVRYRIAALTGSEDPASGVFKATVTK